MNNTSFRDLLLRTWDLYTTHFHYFFIVAFVFFLPLELVDVFVLPRLGITEEWLATAIENVQIAELVTRMSLVLLLSTAVGLSAQFAIFYGVKRAYEHQPLEWKSIVREARAHFLPFVGTSILQTVLLSLLCIALIVPGIIFGVYWMFAQAAVVFTGKRGMQALRYSKALVKGRWWSVLGRFVILGIAYVILEGMYSALMPDVWLQQAPVVVIVNMIWSILALFLSVFLAMYFLDLHTLHETKHSAKTE